MNKLTSLPSWKQLKNHFNKIQHSHMRELFEKDPFRQEKYSIIFEDILFDYSKNRVTEKTMTLLLDLADESKLKHWIEKLVRGDKVNFTENNAALHTALRTPAQHSTQLKNKDIINDVHRQLDKMERFTEIVRCGEWAGYTGKAITDIVNIGIGGSDLGPQMITQALKPYQIKNMKFHFISNIDARHFLDITDKLNPETTLFIIVSKSFKTQETMLNAHSARRWFLQRAKNSELVSQHFVAVSTNIKKVTEFGIKQENIFLFWDWVGGRYSLWSSVGMSIALSVGMKRFRELLAGANAMDNHFSTAPFNKNIPVIMGLLGIWYNNFFGCESHAILPYDHLLNQLPAYLEQADMESNGKSITRSGNKTNYSTGCIVWGAQGINGQHAFYQLMHQGTKLIPADFISSAIPQIGLPEHHETMLSNFIAQSEALMRGRNHDETLQELKLQGLSHDEIESCLPHMVFEGNRPTNSILFRQVTPRTLGSLIAMYEHKVFVQGIIWNINSFDQWGVELGKTLAKKVLADLKSNHSCEHDSSTNSLIRYFKLLNRDNCVL